MNTFAIQFLMTSILEPKETGAVLKVSRPELALLYETGQLSRRTKKGLTERLNFDT